MNNEIENYSKVIDISLEGVEISVSKENYENLWIVRAKKYDISAEGSAKDEALDAFKMVFENWIRLLLIEHEK